jgi:hypothetical protein
MSAIDSSEQIESPVCGFLSAEGLTVAAAWLVAIVAAAAALATSPAFAQQHAAHLKGLHALTSAPRTQVTVDRNDPALTGGGSLGYNQRVEQGF